MNRMQWRDSMRSPKLYFLDLRLFVLLLAWVFWPRLWTFVPVLAVMIFLTVVSYKGYRPGAAVRAVRRRLTGDARALSPRRYRRIVDFGAVLLGAGLVAGEGRAEFEYVPPIILDEDAPVLAGVAPPVELSFDERLGALEAALDEPAPWVVRPGSLLGEVLEEWGERAGVEVVMLTDREYQIDSRHEFHGEFVDAVRTLLFGLGHFSHAPVGRVLKEGKVLAVFHRGPGRKGAG